jgi:2'-5' RNA ligase
MTRFVAVLPLAPLAVDDGFSATAWPLHVTIVSNFTTDATVERIGTELSTNATAMDVEVGGEAMFGPRENVPVSLVRHSEPLATLHRALVARLRSLDVVFDNPNFIDAGYRPHVTATRHASASDGDRLRLTQLTLVDMEPHGDAGLRRVVWETALGD